MDRCRRRRCLALSEPSLAPGRRARAEPCWPRPAASSAAEGKALKRLVHRTIAQVTGELERLHFNKAVALVRELSNAIEPFAPASAADRALLREALETVVVLLGPMVPHLAEELWQLLGHERLLVETPWPEADPAWLVADTVIVPIQVNGKRRAELELPRGSSRCRRSRRWRWPTPPCAGHGGQAAAPRGGGAGQDRQCRGLTPAAVSPCCVLLAAGGVQPAADLRAARRRGRSCPTSPPSTSPSSTAGAASICAATCSTSSTREGVQVPAAYQLDIVLRQESNSLAIQLDNTATRANLALGAAFTLKRRSDGVVLYDSAVRRVVSYNIRSDPFATLITEQDAERRAAREVARQIRTILSLYFANQAA